jgi:ankyrin repeat protein
MRLKDVFSSPSRRATQLFAELELRPPRGKPDEGKMLRLISEGVDLRARAQGGLTPLLYATCAGHAAVAQALLDAGANVFDRDNDREARTALILASIGGYAGICRALLAAGAPVNAADMAGSTALHEAMFHPAVVSLLIAAGADINATDMDGWTPLYRAARNGQGRAVSLLLLAGANPRAKDKEGNTPLDALVHAPRSCRAGIARKLRLALQGEGPAPYADRFREARRKHSEKLAPRATVLQKDIAVKRPLVFKK